MERRLTNDIEQKIYSEPTVPIIAGTYSGLVRIIGGGSSMWDDYKKSEEMFPGTDTIAVNIAGLVHPSITHLFSWHPKQISAIKMFRQAEWADDKSIVHSVAEGSMVNCVWNFNGATSVSGTTACELAWLLGYRKIVLCGIPLDGNGYFYKPMDNPDIHDKYRKREVFKLHEFFGADTVRSFSGYTKQILGEPAKEWGQ
jgi:hypothetical protein